MEFGTVEQFIYLGNNIRCRSVSRAFHCYNTEAGGHVASYFRAFVGDDKGQDVTPDFFGNGDGSLTVGFRQDTNKFFTTITGGKVCNPGNRARYDLTNLPQTLISVDMPGTIVELLEVITILHTKRQFATLSGMTGMFL